jgi:hypothetical protein
MYIFLTPLMAASLYIKGSKSERSNEIFRYAACVEKLFTGDFSGLENWWIFLLLIGAIGAF